MKVFIGCLLFLQVTCFFSSAFGQNPSVRGDVFIDDNLPAEAATILLLTVADSSILKSALSNANGRFEFGNVKPGRYYISINKMGCAFYKSLPFAVSPGTNYEAGRIVLKQLSKNLTAVTVADRKQFIEVKASKIVLNISDNSLAAGHSAIEILGMAPGIKVSSDDEILYRAGQKALVTINGKTVNLSGKDLSNLLQNTQSSQIERIELLPNPPAKYDAAGAGGVINIILKRQKDLGANAALTLGGGFGNYYKSNAGLSWNYRNEKVNIFGSATLAYNKSNRGFDVDRNVHQPAQTTNFKVAYNSAQTGPASNFRVGSDFFVDSVNTIGFVINGFFNRFDFDKSNYTAISLPGGPVDTALSTAAILKRRIGFANFNLNYSRLGKRGTQLSVDADHSEYRRRSFEDIVTNPFYNATAKKPPVSPAYLSNISPGKINISTAKADLTHPFSPTFKIDAGLKYSKVRSDNDQSFGQLLNGTYQSVSQLTDHFIYNESIRMAYTSVSKKYKQWSFSLATRVENTSYTASSVRMSREVDRDYTRFFPYGQVDYTLNNDNQLSFSYTSRLDRPNYEELNPFIAYQDRYNFSSGNPYLVPSYSKNLQLSHTYKDKYITSLYGSMVTDAYNFTFFTQNDSTKSATATKRNLGRIYTIGLQVVVPVKLTSFWTSTFDVDAAWLRYTTYRANGDLNQPTTDILLKATQNFKLPAGISADLLASYETPTFWGIVKLRENYYINAGIGRSIPKSGLSVRLNIDDILNSRRTLYSTDFANLDLTGYDKRETRIFRLSMTYRFGSTAIKSARKRANGNDDEQKRLGN